MLVETSILKIVEVKFHHAILFTKRPAIEILDAECNKELPLLYDWGTLISETTVNYLKYNDSCIALKSLYYTPSIANCCNHHPTDHIKIILTSRFKYVRAYHDQWIRPFYLIYHSLLFKRKGGCDTTILSLKQEEIGEKRSPWFLIVVWISALYSYPVNWNDVGCVHRVVTMYRASSVCEEAQNN